MEETSVTTVHIFGREYKIRGHADKNYIEEMAKFFSDAGDIRRDTGVNQQILAFITAHGVRTVVLGDRIIGCPHEEGTDYDGEYCPRHECAFWVGRDRFSGKMLH